MENKENTISKNNTEIIENAEETTSKTNIQNNTTTNQEVNTTNINAQISTDTENEQCVLTLNKKGSKTAIIILSILLAITVLFATGLGFFAFSDFLNPEVKLNDNLFDENGLLKAKSGEKWGFINTKGSFAINPQFDYVSTFDNGIAVVELDKKYGFINTKGEYIIQPQFDNASNFSNDLAVVKSGNKYGYIDKSGKFVINPQFEDAYSFYSNLAKVKLNDKYGFINTKGEYVINPQFEDAYDFSNDIAAVKSGGKWGYINSKGETIISYQYVRADNISDDGYAIVMNTNKNIIIIDKTGKVITVGEYDAISWQTNDDVCQKDGCFNYASDEYCSTHKTTTSTNNYNYCDAYGCYNIAYYGDYCTTHSYLE